MIAVGRFGGRHAGAPRLLLFVARTVTARARDQRDAQLPQQPGKGEAPGCQRRHEHHWRERVEKWQIERLSHLMGRNGVHSQRKHRSPVQRVVAQREPFDHMSLEAEYEQHRNPPRPGGPVEHRKPLDER
jgi:hypothetical protein